MLLSPVKLYKLTAATPPGGTAAGAAATGGAGGGTFFRLLLLLPAPLGPLGSGRRGTGDPTCAGVLLTAKTPGALAGAGAEGVLTGGGAAATAAGAPRDGGAAVADPTEGGGRTTPAGGKAEAGGGKLVGGGSALGGGTFDKDGGGACSPCGVSHPDDPRAVGVGGGPFRVCTVGVPSTAVGLTACLAGVPGANPSKGAISVQCVTKYSTQ